VSVITGGVVVIVVSTLIYKCWKLHMLRKYGVRGQPPPGLPLVAAPADTTAAAAVIASRTNGNVSLSMTSGNSSVVTTYDVVKDRPVRFSSLQLQEFTGDYAEKLGAGGFGTVYKGQIPLPESGSLAVAVKVLHSGLGRRAEEQFMAEIGTIGRTSHVNLVRLFGFCFDADLKALVYEFMPNGSLDDHLFLNNSAERLGFDTLYDIAVGTGTAIRYLHDECERRIIHYDIKPGNVLLDESFRPKVADFGLARLCDRERTHLTMTGGGRGTPGYAAPELWMAAPATHKCDVYSYGMLLFEVLGRRRNYVDAEEDSGERWYPRWVWQRLDRGEMEAVVERALLDKNVAGSKDARKKVVRMCAVALLCVQYRPEDRPPMSRVVRMLEGDEEVTAPAVSPFAHLDSEPLFSLSVTGTTTATLDSDASLSSA
jgi:serine/threonine protein kinase